MAGELEKVHVGRGIQQAECAVDLERLGDAAAAEADGEHELENVALDDVFSDGRKAAVKLVTAEAGLAGLMAAAGGWWGDAGAQGCDDFAAETGALPFRAAVQEGRAAGEVVKDQHALRADEIDLRNTLFAEGGQREFLNCAHKVVPDKADQAALKGDGGDGAGGGFTGLHVRAGFELLTKNGGKVCRACGGGSGLAIDLEIAVGHADAFGYSEADERVTPEGVAVLDAFEQKDGAKNA